MRLQKFNLIDLVDIVNSGVNEFNGEKKYIATGSLETDNIIDYVNVTFDSRPSRANIEFKENDVIFAKMKDTEKVFLIDKTTSEYLYSTGFAGLRVKSKNKILPKFLYFWIRSSTFQEEKNRKSGGATQKAINNTKLKKFNITLPSLKDQYNVIESLEKAENLKKYREKLDKLINNYLTSIFLEMFGDPVLNTKKWNIKKIKDIAEVKTGGTPSRQNNEYWNNGTIPWVKTTEIDGSTIYKVQEFITEKGLDGSNAVLLPKNTVLVAMYGQGKTRGKVGKLGISSTTNQACAGILPSNNYNSDYLLFYLKNSYESLRNLGRGGNQPNLNLSMVKSFKVQLPPFELQNKFAKIVQKTGKIKEYQKQSKIEIDNLFNNLMQKAFKGELSC